MFCYLVKFQYIWTNHLTKNNKGCALVGTKTSNNNNKSNDITTTNFKWLYSIPPYFGSLQSSVHHIGGWNYPKLMHKSKYTSIIV